MGKPRSKETAPGTTYGELTIVEEQETVQGAPRRVLVRCSCGLQFSIVAKKLHQKSRCAVKRNHQNLTLTYKSEHNSWRAMIERCYNPKHEFYHCYGLRGITVAEDWKGPDGFRTFLECIGPKPSSEYSLDRKDVNGPYAPGNVQWSDPIAQGNNRTNNNIIEINGELKTLTEWCRANDIDAKVVKSRLHRGWSINDALKRPQKASPLWEYKGQLRTCNEWAKIVNIPRKVLQSRVKELGWPVERALTTPRKVRR